jgi:hypothetical protein
MSTFQKSATISFLDSIIISLLPKRTDFNQSNEMLRGGSVEKEVDCLFDERVVDVFLMCAFVHGQSSESLSESIEERVKYSFAGQFGVN